MDTMQLHEENLERQVVVARKDLKEAAEWLHRRMEQLMKTCDQGGGVNSLGEVQSLGPNVDRLCALLDAKERELQMFRSVRAAAEQAEG